MLRSYAVGLVFRERKETFGKDLVGNIIYLLIPININYNLWRKGPRRPASQASTEPVTVQPSEES